MLENDRHLFRVFLAQAGRDAHARRAGVERDVEMVLAREPVLGGIGQDAVNHSAQRLLGQEIITDMVGRHERARVRSRHEIRHSMVARRPANSSQLANTAAFRLESKWRLLLPGASEPRLTRLASGLEDRSFKLRYAA